MANLSYRQPKMPLANPPRWLVSEIFGHESYVTSVTFFGENYDRIVSGSYDEVAKVCFGLNVPLNIMHRHRSTDSRVFCS